MIRAGGPTPDVPGVAMGYWGTFVVARTAGPVAELPGLADRGHDVEDEWVGGGWRVATFDMLDDDEQNALVRDLAVRTGAPVLAADVLDSDHAALRGAVPGGEPWRLALRPDGMREYLAFHDPDGGALFPMTATDALAAVLAWSRAAGLDPDEPAVAATLVEEEAVFVEELLFTLLEQLGLPELILQEEALG